MTLPQPEDGPPGAGSKREAVLHVMAAAAFLVFFQAYLVAPLISTLRPLCVLTLLRAITAR